MWTRVDVSVSGTVKQNCENIRNIRKYLGVKVEEGTLKQYRKASIKIIIISA
jgi:hypothetical protein